MHNKEFSSLAASFCLLILTGISLRAGTPGIPRDDKDTSMYSPFNTSPFSIPEIHATMKFDGILDDQCWNELTPMQLVMHIPTFGNEPSERSEVYLFHDKVYLYIGGRFYDKEAGKINVTSKVRDNINPSEDTFTALFDTFHDHENAVGFQTNAAGVRQDMTIARDGTDQFPWNGTWNTFWDVETTRDTAGWYMEMRIPLSSLRFREEDGIVNMGMILFRYIPRKFEIDITPAIPRNWGFWSFAKPSQAKIINMAGIPVKKPFYIAPYVSGGLNSEAVLNTAGDAYVVQRDPKLTGGLDIKYGLTSNLTADITLNTDFAQVEADNAQINLTRFSLFFPEKRMFFMERSSNFAFDFDGRNTVFYSRRIGLNNGRAVPIIGGARLVGRAGKWDIGFLNMQTSRLKSSDAGGTDIPSENFGVLRLRRQVINQNSYMGAILSSRIGSDGSFNQVVGVDGIIKVFGNDFLDLKYAQSFDDKYTNRIFSGDASRIWLDWQRRNEKGIGYDFFYSRSGENYQPGMGFEFRTDYYSAGTKLKYGIIAREKSKIARTTIMLNGQIWKENGSNITQSALVSAGFNLNLKSSTGFSLELNNAYESLPDTFYLSRGADVAYIGSGNYNYNFATFSFNTPFTRKFALILMTNIGQYYDGTQAVIRLGSNIKIGSFLSIEPGYEYDRIRFSKRNQAFDGHIAGLRSVFMFSKKLSVSSLIQYSSIANGIVSNVRLRYNPREGNDLYIVFNEGRNIELNRELPVLNRVANAGVLVKYTYTFIL